MQSADSQRSSFTQDDDQSELVSAQHSDQGFDGKRAAHSDSQTQSQNQKHFRAHAMPNGENLNGLKSSKPLIERLRQASLRFLALSAAIDFEVLERVGEHGNQGGNRVFMRGRFKYYGLGSLVIFFAVFAGYGMGHMLSTMANMSWLGASIAGVVWAVFQWCLERQILISIQHDAVWWQKIFGITWRSALALMSASVMVYPFFVETNRAEIDVKIGQITQRRLQDAKEVTASIADLPRLEQESQAHAINLTRLEKAMSSDAPDIASFQIRAKQCWLRQQKTDATLARQQRGLSLLRERPGVDLVLDARIQALEDQREQAKEQCRQAESAIAKRNADWRQLKSKEHAQVAEQQRLTLEETKLAQSKRDQLFDEQEKRVQASAHSGFAADFYAVARLMEEDPYRRFQMMWWMLWFLAIEMVAILVKFGTKTDVDLYLSLAEKALVNNIEADFKAKQMQLTTQHLREQVQTEAEHAYWNGPALEIHSQRVQEQEMQRMQKEDECATMQRDCHRSVQMLEAALHEWEALEVLKRRATHRANEEQDSQQVQTLRHLCTVAEADLVKRLQTHLNGVVG
ncbi:DUF4407 domain-containing protein [Undibacterium cyanobacteriorum]|uniref:DUF4407 domain-containing protein n=1 Tax=Undibacterium cyanobacteriorum TaxID=3073561 RepID=A0ABY9RR78_9BURK|nr:DUF4407 domain-containing protein [Undibacterium sp. 20NA77.5]WMW82451.1 DUF4407 domain-containing protein [Undibacterium sp. 20NA77.5]